MFEFSSWLRNRFKGSYHGFNLSSWLKQTFRAARGGRTGTIYTHPASRRTTLNVEALEDRTVPTIIDVNPVAIPSALNNDFTVLQNALDSAASGDTVDIHGTFDWTEFNADASYVASVGASDTADIRGLKVPDGVNNLTITSSTNDAHIMGLGDFDNDVYDSFLFTDDSTSANGGANAVGNTNLTVEDLNIDNFESAVTMGWNSTGTYNGTQIQDNQIELGGDNDTNVAFNVQNIAIYFTAGHNQHLTGNTVTFAGNGTNTATSPRSFGFQDSTTGGTGYDGLVIDNNTFQLASTSTGTEIDNGIWENGHNDDNSSHISITNNQFLGRTGIDDFDRALLLSSQTTGLVVDGNHFTDVDNVFYASKSQGHSPGDQFTFTNNVLTRVGGADGIFIQNVTNDPTPIHVTINWNINNTIDGFTGVRGLNELSTDATGSSRPTGAATDLNAVIGVGPIATTFVASGWTGAGRFTDPDGIGTGAGPVAFAFNGFTTIQAGVNTVDPTGTVNVLAGSYAENVLVNKSVSILGPNATIDPNTGIRVAEAIVMPAVTETSLQGSTSGTIFRVGSGAGHVDVTIKGLTIDGHNDNLSGGRTLNGVEIDTGAGIVNSIGSFDANPGAFNTTMIVQNNVIKNLERYGVLVDNVASRPAVAGNDVSHNKIDNIPSGNNFGGDRGRGVAFEENVYGTVSYNVMTRVNVGWQDDNYNLASPGAGTLVDHNIIYTYHRGIFHNLQYQNATAATISNNSISVETSGDFSASSTNFGIELSSIQSTVGVNVTDNNVTGTVYGLLLWNMPTTGTVTISGGTLTNNDVGVYATSNDPQFGAGAPSSATISGITIVNPTTAGVQVDTSTFAASFDLEVTGDTEISGGPVGVSVLGADSSANIHDNSASIHGNLIGIDVNAGFADIDNNHIYDNTTGIRLTNGGTATITNNDFEGAANPDNGKDIRLDTDAGLITGGTLTGNTFAGATYIDNRSAQNITALATSNTYKRDNATVETDNFAIEDRIYHKIDNAASGLVTWVANDIFVTPATSPTATDNDYTRLANAIAAATDGVTINLQGTFDWTETNAAASWALGNDGLAGTNDDYSLLVPANLNGVTLTAPSLGSATIQGPGDLPNFNLEGFLAFWTPGAGPSATNQNWTISNLQIYDFDLGIGEFFDANSHQFDGNQIINNHIRLARDLNATAAPADVNQNIAIYLSFGQNQTVQGNIIDLQGDGVSDSANGNFSSEVGLQSDTGGGDVYDGLLIAGNTINVLHAQSADPEKISGIWENGDGTGSNITVTNNHFINLDPANDPAANLQIAFRLTSPSSATTTVQYSNNQVDGANIGFQYYPGYNNSGTPAVQFVSNTLTNVITGFDFANATTVNHLSGNSVTGIGAAGTGIAVGAGSSATIDNSFGSNGIHDFATGILVQGNAIISGNSATISGNGIGIDVDGGSASVTNNTITANGTGIHVTNGGTLTSVANNFITNQTTTLGTGIGIDIDATAGAIAAIFNNDLSGNAVLAINNGTSTVVDAAGNWWGTSTPAGVAAEVSINVDYSPWLNLGTEDPATGPDAGFQGDFSSLHVDANSPQVAPTGRIQEAINLLADGSLIGGARVIDVAAGTYQENDSVNKSGQILGPNAGVSGNGARGPEATVITNGNQFFPTLPLGTTNAIFTVSASNVTIQGLTIDGDDPAVNGGPLQSGVDANTFYAVLRTGGDNLLVADNIVKDVYIGVRGDGNSTGNLIASNWFHDIGAFDFGYAITLRTGYYADIMNNQMDRVYTGVHINDFSVPNGPTWTMSGNNINSYAAGLWFNQSYSSATPLTVSDNQFSAEASAVANNIGILITNGPGAVGGTYTGNTITGQDYGVIVWDTDATVTLDGTNSIVNSHKAGVLVTNNVGFNPIGNTLLNLTATPSTVELDGIAISTNVAGADGVIVQGDTGGGVSTLTAQNDTAISGAATGILVSGPNASASITANTITANGTGIHVTNGGTLTSVANNFITNQTTALGTGDGIDIDATAGAISAIFNNNLAGNQTLAINNGAVGVIDASGNWWGSNNESIVQSTISGTVDFTPFLDTGADVGADPTDGFQGDFSILDVTTLGAQTTGGRITEALNLVDDTGPSGGRINIRSGNYIENVDASANTVTLAPGASPGLVNLTGNLTLGGTDTFDVDIASAAPGTGYDQWIVSGDVTLGSATLNMNFTYVPAPSDSPFVFIDNQGPDPISGQFAATPTGTGFTSIAPAGGASRIQVPDSSSSSNIIYYILYDGPNHTGNDMVLDKAITAGTLTPPTGLAEADTVTAQTVFTFTSGNPSATPADFTATVNTGDGTFDSVNDPGIVQIAVNGSGGFDVRLTYTYREELATQPFSVSVVDTDGQTASASGTITVTDPPLTNFVAAGPVNAVEGAAFTHVLLATFDDPGNPTGDLSLEVSGIDYVADINWDDGTGIQVNSGTIEWNGAHFEVFGSHTYTEESSPDHVPGGVDSFYTITVAIHHDLTADPTPVTLSAFVSDPDVDGTGGSQAITPVEGISGTFLVATFTDPGNPTGTVENIATDYAANIDWGDGTTPSSGTITYNAVTGSFEVRGTHTYAEESAPDHSGSFPNYTINVAISHELTTPQFVTSIATVSDPAVVAVQGQAVVTAVEGGSTNLVILATFTDPGGPEPANDYSADVDWGDSTSLDTSVFILSAGGGQFLVLGSHTYAEESSLAGFTIVTTIHHEVAPDTVVNSLKAVVSDPSVNATGGFHLTSLEGVSSGTQTVATFTDPGGPELSGPTTPAPGEYAATIDWGDGGPTSIGVISYSGGTFTVQGSHTYVQEGTYTISVLLQHGTSPNVNVTSTASVADQQITVPVVTAPTGVLENLSTGPLTALATFDDPAGVGVEDPAGDFTATINWGDGFFAPGVVVYTGTGNTYEVDAPAHTYIEEGVYTISVSVKHDSLPTLTGTQSVTVADQQITTPIVATLTPTEGAPTGTIVGIATFTDPAGAGVESPSDFNAIINWGDSTSTDTGVVVSLGGGQYRVDAPTHTFADEATGLTLTVTVSHESLAAVPGNHLFNVADAPLTAGAFTPPSAVEGAPITNAVLFHFTDANPGATPGDYTATVVWGDGATETNIANPTHVQIVASGAGFDVVGSHTYAEEATGLTFSVTVVDHTATTSQSTNTFSVADAPLTAGAFTPPSATEGLPVTNAVLFHFTDANPAGTASDYTATVVWGDGLTEDSAANPTDVQIVANGGGFDVVGSHTYLEEATGHIFSVSVVDHFAAVSQGTSGFSVADADLTAGALTPPNTHQGAAFTDQVLFHFTDANPGATAADFSALITWGDTTTSTVTSTHSAAGQIVASGGGFDVLGSHTYAVQVTNGTFSVTVTDHPKTASASTNINVPIFSDNFDRSDAPTLGSNWTTQTGTFGISSHTAVTSSSQVSLATVNGLSLTNVVVQADINVTTPGSNAGLMARYSGPAQSNFYLGLVYFDGTTYWADIFVNHGGGFARLSMQSLSGFTGTGTLRFEVVGNELKLFVNNVVQGVAYDSTISTPGLVGMRGVAASLDNFSATSVQVLQTSLPYTDTFTKPDGSDLDRVWTERLGAFTIQNQQAVPAPVAGVSIATLNTAASANVSVQADINVTTPGATAGLVARYSGPAESNFYLGLVYFNGSSYSADIFVNHGGGYTRLSVQSLPGFTGTGTLRFEVVGNQLKLFVNNVLQVLAYDSTISTPGLVGMRGVSSSLDNWTASPVVTQTQSLPFTDGFNKPDNSDLDRDWTERVGAFTTQNSQAADAANLAPVSLATVNGVSAANVTVQAQITLNGIGSGAGLIARYTGPDQSNFYLGMLFNNNGVYQALIFLNQGGNFTKLASQNLPGVPAPGVLRFVVSGNSLTLFVDGVQQASATDSTLTGPGQVGIRSANASLDNFSAQ